MQITFRITRLNGHWQIQDTPRAHPARYVSLRAAIKYLRDCRTPPRMSAAIQVTDRRGRSRTIHTRHRIVE